MVHARKGTNVGKDSVCKLEGINIAKPELDMGIDDKLCPVQNFSTWVESILKWDFFCSFMVSILLNEIVNKRQCWRIGIIYFTGFKFIL